MNFISVGFISLQFMWAFRQMTMDFFDGVNRLTVLTGPFDNDSIVIESIIACSDP